MIVRFLAHADRLIGRYIRAKQKLIKLLDEQKRAIIHRAVTRGLDSEVKLKPSGIAWLGDVPAHWEVKRLKNLVHLQSGDSITAFQIEESGEYPVFGGNGLRGYTSEFNRDGDFVLIGRQGALCGNINYASGKFFASEHAVVANPLVQFVTHWLGELLRTMNLNQYSIAAAQPGLSVDRISVLPIPVPSINEQAQIMRAIGTETAELLHAMSQLEREIALLREYRTRLIADVVTGKLDVRAVSADLPEELEVAAEDAEMLGDVEDLAGEPVDDEATEEAA